MARRSRAPSPHATSPFDVPGTASRGREEAAEEPVEAWPEIGPPVLLEPVPPPTVLAAPEPVAPLEDVDAYALAAAAASSMEREGRTFDTPLDFGDDLPRHVDPADELDALERWPTPDTEDVAFADPEPEPEPPRPVARTVPPVKRAPPKRGGKASKGGLLGWAAIGLALAAAGLAAIVLVLALSSRSDDDEAVLRPVSHDLDALAGARAKNRFATPPAELPGAGTGTLAPTGRAPVAGTSRVRVSSDPPGAVVRLDGRVHGRTPIELDLPLGAYSAEIALDGHAPFRQILTVDEAEEALSATLAPDVAWGKAHVVAPGWQGGTLTVDGKEVGKVPLTIDLQPGDHVFVVTRGEDRLESRRKVLVTRDQVLEVDLTK